MAYFNETGPIYQQELVQANAFSRFVHAHVVAANQGPDGNPDSENDSVRFDWEGFRLAVSSSQDLSFEHELCVLTAPHSVDPTTRTTAEINRSDANATTLRAVLDTLVARFASLFAHALFIPTSNTAIPPIDTGYGVDEVPRTKAQCQAYFFDVLRRNLYCAFTLHLGATDAHEHYLSMQRCSHLDDDVSSRSLCEYRLLFVHSDTQSRTGKGLVVTVTLEGNFEDEIRRVQSNGDEVTDTDDEDDDDHEAWYGVSLDSKGPFSGVLRAMQLTFEEGFRFS